MEPQKIEIKEPLKLSEPAEKLLRAPTFFEKYAWLKPISILTILIITIILSTYLLQAKNPGPDCCLRKTPSPNIIRTNRDTGLKTYTSTEGKYSLKYPIAYTLSDNTSSNTAQIYSNIIPETNTNFRMTISFKPTNNQTLQQLINENKICPDIPLAKGTQSVINGNKAAQIYLDTPCGTYPTTIVYTINNQTLYIISIETLSKFNEIKQYTDQIFSTLKFLDATTINPTLSCRPRPACLDSVPRCMIPETPDMCPKTAPTQKQVFCTQDAKQCPDRSWVGRTGPKCEFICPQTANILQAKNTCQEKGGTWLDKYQECESIPSDQGLDQAACTAFGGTFNSCASACRHNPPNLKEYCTDACVKTCKFN